MPDPAWDAFVGGLDPRKVERERLPATPPRAERPGSAADRALRQEHALQVEAFHLERAWRQQYLERETARRREDPYRHLPEPPI